MKLKLSLLFTSFLLIITAWSTDQKSVFDIPALKDKSIDQIVKILGKPSEELIPTALEIKSHITGIKFFTRGKYVLDVEYYGASRKVETLFLGEKGMVADYKPLIAVGNLINTKDYYIEPVKAQKDHSKFTGINITPK